MDERGAKRRRCILEHEWETVEQQLGYCKAIECDAARAAYCKSLGFNKERLEFAFHPSNFPHVDPATGLPQDALRVPWIFVHAQNVQRHGEGRSERRFGLCESLGPSPERARRRFRLCEFWLFSSARGGLESGLELQIREKRSAHIFNRRPLI